MSVEEGLALGWQRGAHLSGALVLQQSQPWYSTDRALWDRIFYVLPEARRSRAAVALIAAAKACARSRKLPLNIAVSSGADIDRKNEFMRRQGFRPLGGVYCWRA